MRCGMDNHSGSVPVDIQYGDGNIRRYINVLTERPKRVCTVHEDVAHSEGLGGAACTEPLVSCPTQPICELGDGHLGEALRRFAH